MNGGQTLDGELGDLPSLGLATTEHAPLPMATVEGISQTVRYVNPAFARLMARPKEALLGKTFCELMPAKDQCVTLLERVARTGKAENFTERDSVNSHPVFWSYTIWPVQGEGGLVGVMIQVTESTKHHEDTVAMNQALMLGSLRQHEMAEAAENLNAQLRAQIAEREKAEEALRESEERFRSLFSSAPMAVFACDRDAIIQHYNLRAVELWGREPALGDGKTLRFSPALAPDGTLLPHEESPIMEVLRTGTSALNVEMFIERPGGSCLPVLANFAALKDGRGEITGVITSFIDITERRLLEDALVARAADLVRAGRSKDEFLAMLAHELRNPLAPLRNAAEIFRTTAAGTDAREEAQHILARQIENMSRMIDDLLDVSRITEGKIDLRSQVVALDAIVAAAANLARPGINVRSQDLAITLPAEPIYLNADATRLEQVFGNLLTNASKYTDSGCRISLSAERLTDHGQERPEVIVRVRDEGIGISPELLPRIFDLFVQAKGALDRAQGGLGIGLTLVQRLVKLHGGSVEAHSEGLGRGSEFIVRLPIFLGASTPPPPPPPHALVTGESSRRMLIVDDNEDSARSMSMLQRLRGHETRTAFTGPAALAVAAEFLPEVVLLDIGLPTMDGFEVARRLRTVPTLEDVFVVAMTGYGSEDDRRAGKAAGFDEYLVKPVDLDRLRAWLRSLPAKTSETT